MSDGAEAKESGQGPYRVNVADPIRGPGAVFYRCPKCSVESYFACPNCKTEDNFTLEDGGARCKCDYVVQWVKCGNCDTNVAPKFFFQHKNAEAAKEAKVKAQGEATKNTVLTWIVGIAILVGGYYGLKSCLCNGEEETPKPAAKVQAASKPEPRPSPPTGEDKPSTADPAVLGSLVNPCGPTDRCWLVSPSTDDDPVMVVASPKEVDAAKRDHLMSGADFSLWQRFYQEIYQEKYAGMSDDAMIKKIARTEEWARSNGKRLADSMFSAKGLVISQAIHQGRVKDQRTQAERDAASTLSPAQARAYHATLTTIARAGLEMTASPNAPSCMPALRKYQPLVKKIREELDTIYRVNLAHKYGYLAVAATHGASCVVCLKSGEFQCKQMLLYLKRRSVKVD